MPSYTNTPWLESAQAHRFSRLDGNLSADVAVIGAGITGVTVALLLKRAGYAVALLESLRVGKGESGRTTAHLTQALDTRYHTLISRFGADGARLAARGQRAAIDRISAFISELRIACDFDWVPGYLYAEPDDHAGADDIDAEASAASSLGIEVELVSQIPLPLPVKRALRFLRQGQLHPRKYLLALAERIPGDGSEVLEETHVVDVEEGEPCRVITANGVVTAPVVIVAAHVPISNRIFLHAKLAAYRTYVVAMPTVLSPTVGLCWDTAEPYHYLRTQRVGDTSYLIVGGEDHKVGEEDDTNVPFHRLERYVADRFGRPPAATDWRWSGQIIAPADGLPYVGLNSASRHVYVATGYAGNGVTSGTLAAMVLADEIRGIESPWTGLLSATRWKPLAAAKAVIAENKDYPLHLVADRLSHVGPEAVARLAAGEGCVATIDGHRLAVYRNGAGQLSALSPVCTHLGCLVHWNTTEKSWDCPCHGSRYDPTGRVLNGPAVEALAEKPLPPIEVDPALDDPNARGRVDDEEEEEERRPRALDDDWIPA